jgi:hypothetical protein
LLLTGSIALHFRQCSASRWSRQQFQNRPSVIGQTSGLRWSHFGGGMNPAEIKMGYLQCDGVTVISHGFAVAKRFPSQSAVEQPHVEILAFKVIYGHFGTIWCADSGDAFNPLESNRVFAAGQISADLRVLRVMLDLDPVVDALAKDGFDAALVVFGVQMEPVRGQLKTAPNTRFHAAEKMSGCVAVPLSYGPANNQLGVALRGQEAVLLAMQRIV